jgi:hypothetical protein
MRANQLIPLASMRDFKSPTLMEKDGCEANPGIKDSLQRWRLTAKEIAKGEFLIAAHGHFLGEA